MAWIASPLPDAALSFPISVQLGFHTQFQLLWGDALVSENRVEAEAGLLFFLLPRGVMAEALESQFPFCGCGPQPGSMDPELGAWVWTTAGQHGSGAGSMGVDHSRAAWIQSWEHGCGPQ